VKGPRVVAAVRRVSVVAALVAAWAIAALHPTRARAQEFDPTEGVVPDSIFVEQPRTPLRYQSGYRHDQSRGEWSQSLDYNPTWKSLAMTLSGSSSASEDVISRGSRSTTGDMLGALNYRASQHLILSLNGRYSMSSIADGRRASNSEQRRNDLSFQTQYQTAIAKTGRLTVAGSSEFQRNYDLRASERTVLAGSGNPDSVAVQRDSSYASGRLDGVRAELLWPVVRGLTFDGKAFGSHTRPVTTVRSLRSSQPVDGTPGIDSVDIRKVALPVGNSIFDGTLTFDRLVGTKATLQATRSGIDQVYFDLGQLQVEQFSNDGRLYSLKVESVLAPGLTFLSYGTINRTLRDYVARPNLNALIVAREASAGMAYNKPATMVFLNLVVNRTRAERQATGNGVTISRVLSTNLQQRVLGRLWLVGLGTATLYSYQYLFKFDPADPERSFSKDDRDVASGFGSVGARFAFTPRCSTAVNFSVSRVHNVSIDKSRSSGNLAITTYQLNGSLRIPLNPNLSIGQDYVMTATYRAYDFDEEKDDLSRNFRIDTTVADTLMPFAFIRLDHRYYFFDNGEFSPIDPGGPRFYGVATEQAQQTLEGTIGIRPVPGVTFVVKQNLSDTVNRNLVSATRQGTEQWNLTLGLEVNRSFWNGAGITGTVQREQKYQNLSNLAQSTSEENHWLAGITFQKEF
jgi:hypothetical protein